MVPDYVAVALIERHESSMVRRSMPEAAVLEACGS